MYPTLKQRIMELPESERKARRSLYTDAQWDSDWELNAYPHQIEPMSPDWRTWTIIGGKGVGKTTAGLHWVQDKLLNAPADTITLALFQYRVSVQSAAQSVYNSVYMGPDEFNLRPDTHGGEWTLSNLTRGTKVLFAEQNKAMNFQGRKVAYLWADEINSAPDMMTALPRVRQYLFTEPARLPPETRLSQAGKPRVI